MDYSCRENEEVEDDDLEGKGRQSRGSGSCEVTFLSSEFAVLRRRFAYVKI